MTQLCFTACCYCNEFQSYYYFWHNSNSNSSNYWANWLQCKLQEMIYANLHPCGSAETLQFLKNLRVHHYVSEDYSVFTSFNFLWLLLTVGTKPRPIILPFIKPILLGQCGTFGCFSFEHFWSSLPGPPGSRNKCHSTCQGFLVCLWWDAIRQ